MLSKVFSNF